VFLLVDKNRTFAVQKKMQKRKKKMHIRRDCPWNFLFPRIGQVFLIYPVYTGEEAQGKHGDRLMKSPTPDENVAKTES